MTQLRWAVAATMLCGCEAGTGELLDCSAAVSITSAKTRQGAPLAWPQGDCIRVEYAPELAARKAEIEAAFAAWTFQCGSLCLEAPVEAAAATTSERVIRVTPLSGNLPTGSRGAATLIYDITDGRISTATIEIDSTLPSPRLQRALLLYIGLSLGFQTAAEGVESVLTATYDDALSAPTGADVAAYCAKYGTCAER